jgi:peroxiredoxin
MPQLMAPGTTAPDFRLRVTPDQDLSLSELRGQRVIFSFYPADWSPVCGDQITPYNEVRQEFEKYDGKILGISVDGVLCHQAYAARIQAWAYLCFLQLCDTSGYRSRGCATLWRLAASPIRCGGVSAAG